MDDECVGVLACMRMREKERKKKHTTEIDRETEKLNIVVESVGCVYECSCIRVICMFCAVNVTSIVFVVILRCNCCYLFNYTSFSSGSFFHSPVHAQYICFHPVFL